MKFGEFKKRISELDVSDDALVSIETCCERQNAENIEIEPASFDVTETYVNIVGVI